MIGAQGGPPNVCAAGADGAVCAGEIPDPGRGNRDLNRIPASMVNIWMRGGKRGGLGSLQVLPINGSGGSGLRSLQVSSIYLVFFTSLSIATIYAINILILSVVT